MLSFEIAILPEDNHNQVFVSTKEPHKVVLASRKGEKRAENPFQGLNT